MGSASVAPDCPYALVGSQHIDDLLEAHVLVLHFKITALPERREELLAALREVVIPSRSIEGVISFDIAQDLTDQNTFIATEVFEDGSALERQEAQAQVARVMELLPTAVSAEPQVVTYEASVAAPAAV